MLDRQVAIIVHLIQLLVLSQRGYCTLDTFVREFSKNEWYDNFYASHSCVLSLVAVGSTSANSSTPRRQVFTQKHAAECRQRQ